MFFRDATGLEWDSPKFNEWFFSDFRDEIIRAKIENDKESLAFAQVQALYRLIGVEDQAWTSHLNMYAKTKIKSIFNSLYGAEMGNKTKVNSTEFIDQYSSFFGG